MVAHAQAPMEVKPAPMPPNLEIGRRRKAIAQKRAAIEARRARLERIEHEISEARAARRDKLRAEIEAFEASITVELEAISELKARPRGQE